MSEPINVILKSGNVDIGVKLNQYILTTLNRTADKVQCDIKYYGESSEVMTAMVAYVVKNVAKELGLNCKDFFKEVYDVIELMYKEEKESVPGYNKSDFKSRSLDY